ncbi:Transposase and inactivated derivatives, IS30 family [Paraburkholderia phenazinium]|uniref:Transposase and inactivated derivatives, IS30 family n=1 Tax=Paraburkholderia phenazinium TaxID=60549 RepID=A0A1G7TJQ6_9BURK|nr:Transposase and inactivated derivatives, IS30 family [Paraburkholderia phenazinium]
MNLLFGAINKARAEWGCSQIPDCKVTRPKAPPHRDRVLSDEEEVILVAAARANSNEYLAPVIEWALATAMRAGEIVNLLWSDIDWKKRTCRVREAKNGTPRNVPLRQFLGNRFHWRDRLEYRASVAQWKAELVAQRPKPSKLVTNPRLHHYVQDRLEGKVRDADGREIAGPRQAPFKGRNKPHRGDRKWVNGWSPEQISKRLQFDFPDDESMRISHEAIYQALYIQSRGALKRELVSCLRTGRALRVPRARAQAKAWAHVSEDVMISSRPAEVQDRAVPGHWEGDLIIGLNRSAIGTLVERSSRFTMLVHLPREKGYGLTPRTKNGPALAGYGAVTMANALKKTVTDMPALLWQSLTWDRGKELSDHARFTVESGVKVFFADPHSPWQRGTNENTNGLLRQYFPKGTDLSRWSAREIQAVANALNTRPRKTLGWKTPAEALDEYLKSVQQSSVATTG